MGRASSIRTHHRSYEYEDGEDELKSRRMDTSSEGGWGPEGVIAPHIEWNGIAHSILTWVLLSGEGGGTPSPL
jgi:hypothetical protein